MLYVRQRQHGRMIKSVNRGVTLPHGLDSVLYHLRLCDSGPAALRFLSIVWHSANYLLGDWEESVSYCMKNTLNNVWHIVVSVNKHQQLLCTRGSFFASHLRRSSLCSFQGIII